MKVGPGGLKTLSRGTPDHLWPYLCMCQLCTNRNGSLLMPCASVKLLTFHPPRLCLGPPSRLPCHVTDTWTSEGCKLSGKNNTHNIFTICSFYSLSTFFCKGKMTEIHKCSMIRHSSVWFICMFAGWREGKSWKATWHFWGEFGG